MTNMVTPLVRPAAASSVTPGRLKRNGHPSVPAVADGARDVAAAPTVVTLRAG